MTISLNFTDSITNYDLTWEGSIYFGKIQLGEVKKVAIIIKNNDANQPCYNVIITPTAHPTDQIGTAEETYDITELSFTESGSYSPSLTIPILNAGQELIIWIRWNVTEAALPGTKRFALKCTGRYNI